MADRTMIQGDTYPDLFGQASDATGVLDLTTMSAMTVRIRAPLTGGGYALITGTPVAHTPPIADPDGIHHWNWSYPFAAGDTVQIGAYNVELVCTVSAGKIETFTGPTLAIVEGSTS